MNLNSVLKSFGLAVKSIRKARGLTQEKMADYGFNYRYYQKIEAGQVNTTIDTLVKLAKAFKCKIGDFFNQTGGI